MVRTTQSAFITVRSEGGLLPPDLLARIAAADPELGGLSEADYGLGKDERLGSVMARAWSSCKDYWAGFKAIRARLDESESGVTETREQWVLPLFRELGYRRLSFGSSTEVEGRTYRASHRAGEGEDAPPIDIVSVKRSLDRGEGRRTASDLGVSPQGRLQEYLNRTPHLWGIVTNGRQLRLLRDNESLFRAAYVEFDLEAMMEGGVYADFVLLYLLLHRSRLLRGHADIADCWLERWRLAAVQGGTRALDALRGGVTFALKALGQGLLEHSANDQLRMRLESGELTVTEYYQQLLRLVYRLLFLLVAEERGLLFRPDAAPRLRAIYMADYAVTRLRDRADRRRREDRHDDLWRALGVTFGMMRDGCPPLALEALSGGLFNDQSCPDLDAAHLMNNALLEALRGLSLVRVKNVRRRVNYRDLNVEELGSVYESLLDLHPSLHREGGPVRFDLVEGSERKTTGSYYTPPSLVAELIKSALEPVIVKALVEGKTREDKRKRLLSLKVCDLAVGSGHFLLAAGRRLGREVARLDAGEVEPDIQTQRTAVREVIVHCIYGVDLNPLAIDLCRLALWIEGHVPGRPLTFLDHRIKCGNALVGATPDAVEKGLPDDAFVPLTGDDRAFASGIKKRNRKEAGGENSFFGQVAAGALLGTEASDDEALTIMEIGDVQEVDAGTLRVKEERYAAFRHAEAYERKLFLADAWTAAFFWRLLPERPDPPTAADIRALREGRRTLSPAQQAEVGSLAQQHHFFHWSLEFPDVFADDGGFDCVLGNPPWERIKLQEQEFFAVRNPAIASAPNAAARKRLIEKLPDTDPPLWQAFSLAKHAAEGQSAFVRESGRFPLTAVGDVNLYALFAEQFRSLIGQQGRAGLICPTGIATDDSTKRFFGSLSDTGTLASLFDFENSEAIFPAVHRSYKFCLLTVSGTRVSRADLAFFCSRTSDLQDRVRRFTLSPADIALLNPNTRTCAVFRTGADAELTKAIYGRVPILVDEQSGVNPWSVSFMRMFDMANDSGSFRTREQMEDEGWALDGNVFHRDDDAYLPLYEAKLLHQYDHRWATYDGSAARDLTRIEKDDPQCVVEPRYWLPNKDVDARLADRWQRMWLLGWRDICRNTDERTVIASVFPRAGSGDTFLLAFPSSRTAAEVAVLVGNWNSIVLDYAARQKVGGTHLKYHVFKQLPILRPIDYTASDLNFITTRVLELVYVSLDMQPFARDLGHDGPPFAWDDNRRAVLRAELDAYYARLYGLTRKQLRYILDPQDLTDRELENILDPTEDPPDALRTKDFPGETFRVLKEREIKEYGEYRTKRFVLEAWDRQSQPTLEHLSVIAPDEVGEYISPIDCQIALICRIIDAHSKWNQTATLGRVKVEKLTYLAEQICGLDFERHPVRDAAGPVDFPQLQRVLNRAKAKDVFIEHSHSGGDRFSYHPLDQFEATLNLSAHLFAGNLPQLDALIGLFIGQQTHFTELVTTLYAVWNDLLADGKKPTDEGIFEEFYGWSKDKTKFSRGELRVALAYMRQEHLLPTGKGRVTPAKSHS